MFSSCEEAYWLGLECVCIAPVRGIKGPLQSPDSTVGLHTGHLKSRAPCRGERVAKYDRLIDVDDDIKVRGLPHRYVRAAFYKLHQGARILHELLGHVKGRCIQLHRVTMTYDFPHRLATTHLEQRQTRPLSLSRIVILSPPLQYFRFRDIRRSLYTVRRVSFQ